jgi:iron complex transport system ATP-binding protein
VTLLALENAVARIDGRDALSGVSIALNAGELVAICGPNGAGKSSAIRAALGLLPLTSGRALLGGVDVAGLNPRARAEAAAYLPQERRVAWNLPAVEVAALGAPFLSGADALDRAHAALAEVDAAHLADRGVAEMSGGERARVLLARAFVSQAPALLADEPAAGLDPDAQLMVMERLRARSRAGQGVLVSLHDLTLAARYADRVIGLTGAWIEGPDGPLLASRRV